MMELYIPKTNAFHTAVEVPQDLVDLRTAASVRTGIEAALDNSSHLMEKIATPRMWAQYDPSWFVRVGVPGEMLYNFNEEGVGGPIRDGIGGDEIALVVDGCEVDDVIVVTCTLTKYAKRATGGYFLNATFTQGGGDMHVLATTVMMLDALGTEAYQDTTLHGRLVVQWPGEVRCKIVPFLTMGEHEPSNAIVGAFGEVTLSAVRWRVTA